MRSSTSVLAIAAVLAACGVAAADPKNPPDPPAATWNDPPPAGVEVLKPRKPTWCAGYKAKPWLPGNLIYDELSHGGYSEDFLREVAELACDRPDDAGRQAWIAFYRQGWINIVGTSDREDAEAMAARLGSPPADRDGFDKICRTLWRPGDDASPAERVFDSLRAQAIGCSGIPSEVMYGTDGGAGMASAMYWIDAAGEPPDELVRLAWVLRCYNTGTSSVDAKTVTRAFGRQTVCGHDAAKLDRKKFDKAVDALGLPAIGKVKAREMFTYTRKLLDSYDAAFAAAGADDADLKRLFGEPAKGFAEWIDARKANKDVLDDAYAMEEKFRDAEPRDVAGCRDSLHRALADHVATLKPKTSDDVIDAANDDVGQPILRALIGCDSLEGRHAAVIADRELLGHGRNRRGPRTAAFWHTLDAVTDVAAGRRKFPIQPGSFGAPLPGIDRDLDWNVLAYEATFNKVSFTDDKGRVAKVVAQGDGVMVTFKTESWKEPRYNCKETNRVDRIDETGRLIYRQSCVAAGTETVKVTPQAAWFRRDMAVGIKPGVFVKYRIDAMSKPHEAFPTAVYADQAQKRLIQVWGLPVTP